MCANRYTSKPCISLTSRHTPVIKCHMQLPSQHTRTPIHTHGHTLTQILTLACLHTLHTFSCTLHILLPAPHTVMFTPAESPPPHQHKHTNADTHSYPRTLSNHYSLHVPVFMLQHPLECTCTQTTYMLHTKHLTTIHIDTCHFGTLYTCTVSCHTHTPPHTLYVHTYTNTHIRTHPY